jgi:NAD(P)-dependent dehydrogenase (short-subunit alcohol dehydrogenase family)
VSTAVITGGTRGIGRAVARRLAADGYRTIVLGRSLPDGLDDGVEAMACDVSDADAVDAVFAAIGPVDVLVNCAGSASSNPLARTSLEEWEASHAVNATGPFLCTRAVVGGMIERGRGRIVTVASTAAVEGSRYTAAYTASKHAVLGLMRVVAAEVAGLGVSASTVCPTYVRTEMTEATIRNIADRTGCDLATAEARLAAMTPYGRILEIEEVADAVLEHVAAGDNGRETVLDGGPEG